MTAKPAKPRPMPDPPGVWQPSTTEAPHLYENGVYYPAAVDGPLIDPPSEAEAPHLYENGVCYPASDGVPLPDPRTQERQFVRTVSTLRAYYADQPNTEVSGNTFIYYDEGNIQRRIAPDCHVAFDVDISVLERHDAYRIWAVGKPPDFALEIGSESTADRDLNAKRELYAIIGIGEYWRYDPTPDSEFYGEPLVGEQLVDGQYQRLPVAPDGEGRPRGHSPTLQLDLVWENEDLRFYDPATGEWLRDLGETRAELATERAARVAAEATLADEQTARVAAEARAAELEAELRRLRGDTG